MKKALFGLLIFSFFISSLLFSNQKQKAEDIPGEITMIDAFHIAVKEARKEWDPNAHLYRLTSVDETKKGSQGHNGKRRHWNFIFAVPNTKKLLTMTIHDREVVFFHPSIEIVTPENQVIMDNEVIIDSPEILNKAKEKFDLKPGKDWAIGYHFTLGKFEEIPVSSVVGLNENDQLTKIPFNSSNGEILD